MFLRAAAPTMPHIASGLLLRRLPGRDGDLARACHGELAGGRVLVDRGPGADVGAPCDAHGRDQRGVGADEAIVLDDGAVLAHAVVVAGDGSRADVDARADLGVADIREMVRLRALAEPAR